MDARNEILDAIQILIGRALENTTKIYNATCKGVVASNVALMVVNGVEVRVVFYGDTPTANKQYRVFVPEGNMSNAFMITGGGAGGSKPTTGDYDNLTNKPSINGTTLSGNKTSAELGVYGTGNEPPYPVTSVNGQTGDVTIDVGGDVASVNGKTGDVTLTAADVGALPDTTEIPSKTSQLQNDSGYITADGAPVQSVDGQTGAVTTNAVKTTAQSLTDAQKAQARTNIGAGTSSFSGAYDDLTGKPTIPSKTSELDNDSGFVDTAGASAAAPVQSVNTKTGAVVLTQDDVGDGTTYVRTHNDFTNAAKQQINTNEDNIAMLDSDMEAAQGDITTLKGNVTTLTTALQSKQDTITGGASTITDDNLTANRALVSDGNGKVAVSNVTSTELGYLDGVTSNVQTQLNKKLESAPVTSVNAKTGAVVLGASDVGAVATSDVTQTLGTSTTKVPSEKAVADALSVAGAGDMLASVYDPQGKRTDVFKYVDDKVPTASTATPKVAGTASPGSSKQFARGDHVHPLQNEYEAKLKWGGANLAGSVSPVDAALVPLIGGNKSALCKPDGVTVEYSNDGGETWVDYGATDAQKVMLLSEMSGTKFRIGGKESGNATTDDKLRITVNAHVCGFYTLLQKVLIQVNTESAKNCSVYVEKALLGAPENFTEFGTYGLSGGPGWSSIGLSMTFGGSAGQVANPAVLRFTFSIGELGSRTNVMCVQNILFLGTTPWGMPSNMARNGHLYSYDYLQNAVFPAKVTATSGFAGKGNDVTAAFTKYGTRANIATGEKLSVLFGKIAKWLGDLGSLAFKSTVSKSDLASDVQTSLGKADSALQSYTETDPTVPAWAKAANKPNYTAAEVGLSNVDNVKQYSENNPPPYPVTSVAGKTGDVELAKGDVGLGNVDNVKQYSASNPPPYPVTSVNGETGDVVIEAGGGTTIVLSSSQPSGLKAGDYWYQIVT